MHYLDENFNPKHVVLGVESIKGSPNGEKLSSLANNVIEEFKIDKSKIFLILRDGASAVVRTCRLLEIESQHCFAHATQLVCFLNNGQCK